MENLIKQLIDVATGATGHLNNGMCPDFITGNNSRDEDCPACQVLIEADRIAQQAAGTHPAPCARHCEAEKDAARYRWLRALPKGSCHGSGMTITIAKARPDPCSWMNDSVRGDEMDAAIDAAIQATEAGG